MIHRGSITTCEKHIRKRAFQKAKQTDSDDHWTAYKRLRNDTLSLIRSARKSYDDKLSDSLGDRTLQSKDWWKTLKCFIAPDKPKADIPPLYNNGQYLSDGNDKANVLNDFFHQQTLLDDTNTNLPPLPDLEHIHKLDIISIVTE